MPLCLRTVSGRIGIWNFFFFRGKGKAEEILTSRSKGKQRKVINNLNACMTSTPGFEPSPHWWEESALTPSFSFWFLFVLSSVFFLFFSSLFLEIGRNAPWYCNHLSTYILIVGFHGSNHMLIVRTELSSLSCVVLERVSIGEENCDVTLPWQQNFWITTMGDLGGTTVTATSTAKKQ